MQVNYYIAESEGKGMGIFSNQFIKEGAVVWRSQVDSVLILEPAAVRRHWTRLNDFEKNRFLELTFGDVSIGDGKSVMVPIDSSRYVNHSNSPLMVSYPELSKY